MGYKAALFDFDGTVVDSRHATTLAVQGAFEAFGLPAPAGPAIVDMMGTPVEKMFPLLGGTLYPHDRHDSLIAHFRLLCGPLNETHTLVYDGMPEILSGLNAAGVPCAVVSSKRALLINATYKYTGLEGLFATTVGSEHVTDHKPHPAPALLALSQLQIPPGKDCIMVGDAIVDIEMGRAAGLTTAAVTWGAQDEARLSESRPDYMVHTRDELKLLLLG
jgi:phosphoglycolate phosphatase